MLVPLLFATALLAAAGQEPETIIADGGPRPAHVVREQQRPSAPRLVLPSMHGRDLYDFYCASCHGRDGTGRGPAAAALRTPPPDITRLSLQNGDVFPRARVEAIVTGRSDPPLAAHGSREMPVWGPIFRGLDANEAANRIRIANIVDYLASMQVQHARRPAPETRHRAVLRP